MEASLTTIRHVEPVCKLVRKLRASKIRPILIEIAASSVQQTEAAKNAYQNAHNHQPGVTNFGESRAACAIRTRRTHSPTSVTSCEHTIHKHKDNGNDFEKLRAVCHFLGPFSVEMLADKLDP